MYNRVENIKKCLYDVHLKNLENVNRIVAERFKGGSAEAFCDLLDGKRNSMPSPENFAKWDINSFLAECEKKGLDAYGMSELYAKRFGLPILPLLFTVFECYLEAKLEESRKRELMSYFDF